MSDNMAVATQTASPAAATNASSNGNSTAVYDASPASGSAAASPAANDGHNSNNSNSPRELREAYERLKNEHSTAKQQLETWNQFGDPNNVAAQVQYVQAIHSEANQLAHGLGYSGPEVQAALEQDPVGTLAYLRREVINAQQKRVDPSDPQQLQSLLDRMLNQRLAPIQQQHNQQLTETATAKFDQTFNKCLTDAFPNEDLSPDEREFLYAAVSLVIDDRSIADLKLHGRTAGVQQAFASVKDAFLKAVNAYSGRQTNRPGARPGDQNAGRRNQKPDLDAISRGDFSSISNRL